MGAYRRALRRATRGRGLFGLLAIAALAWVAGASPSSAVEPQADLSLFKTASPTTVAVDDNLTYTLQVGNSGPDAASGVVVTDNLPAGVAFVSASSGCTHSGGTVTCSTAGVPSGNGASFQIVVRPTAHGTITNIARVASATNDPDMRNNTATLATLVTQIATRIDARPVVLDVLPTVIVRIGSAEARLTRADNGVPLAGQLIVFKAGATPLCSATTDGNGLARCTVRLVPETVLAIANLGYDAHFSGTPRYAPSRDDAGLIRINGVIELA